MLCTITGPLSNGLILQVVLAEKPLISEETDLLEPTLLDELICHIASLASVYHKPPTAFVEGPGGLKRALPSRGADNGPSQAAGDGGGVIPEPGSLVGDLLSMDISGGAAAAGGGAGGVDLLGGGLDLLGGGGGAPAAAPVCVLTACFFSMYAFPPICSTYTNICFLLLLSSILPHPGDEFLEVLATTSNTFYNFQYNLHNYTYRARMPFSVTFSDSAAPGHPPPFTFHPRKSGWRRPRVKASRFLGPSLATATRS